MTEPLEAPPGFVAHEAKSPSFRDTCRHCVAWGNYNLCHTLRCAPHQRTDGKYVYFTRAVPAGGEG